MKPILAITFFALALCTPALAQTDDSNSVAPPYVGSADTVSCRMPRAMPGTRLQPVCRTNAEWTRYPTYGMSQNEVKAAPDVGPVFFNGYFEDQPLAGALLGPSH